MQTMMEGIDFVMEEAERQNVADRVVIVAGSDFGRTPMYNENAGKDHWSITSMMMIGPGISGNRVVGATNAAQQPETVDPATMSLDSAGIRIEPEHIHNELRTLAGVSGTDFDALFPVIPSEEMDILG